MDGYIGNKAQGKAWVLQKQAGWIRAEAFWDTYAGVQAIKSALGKNLIRYFGAQGSWDGHNGVGARARP